MLLEREREVEALREVIAGAAAGSGGIAVVEGDPGIGKTTLLDAARELAVEHGLDALGARGGELERDLTFGVARQVLEARVRDGGVRGAARAAAPILGLAEQEGEADEPSIVHGLYWACADLAAGGPLCIAVDDAHWADAASLRWLVYLARRLEEVPVALLVAARTGEPGAPQSLLDALAEQARARSRLLQPSALTAPASEALVRSEAGPDAD
ncbi:MAG TPA: ATP-binding protein, partial [Solirubrobacteraceae bacterium]|nr:ATP-binding protein [Solirubrobacteraceae bacterium]